MYGWGNQSLQTGTCAPHCNCDQNDAHIEDSRESLDALRRQWEGGEGKTEWEKWKGRQHEFSRWSGRPVAEWLYYLRTRIGPGGRVFRAEAWQQLQRSDLEFHQVPAPQTRVCVTKTIDGPDHVEGKLWGYRNRPARLLVEALTRAEPGEVLCHYDAEEQDVGDQEEWIYSLRPIAAIVGRDVANGTKLRARQSPLSHLTEDGEYLEQQEDLKEWWGIGKTSDGDW